MITVTIKKNNSQIKQIKFSGHALYDDYGKDIVCAGVSAIFTTTINAILRYDQNAIFYEVKENVLLKVLKEDKIVYLLILNMIDLLKEMNKDYPKNIIIREDVEDE